MSSDALTLLGVEFQGFLAVRDLWALNGEPVPADPGVYVVSLEAGSEPPFLERSTGGWFKGRNPTASVDRLQDKWVSGTPVLYIGQTTASLRERIRTLLQFGHGRAVGHWGGRYLWQLADATDLVIAWRTTTDPLNTECHLLRAFMADHDGRLPFANIQGPGRRCRNGTPVPAG
jgi:hypothetical protein